MYSCSSLFVSCVSWFKVYVCKFWQFLPMCLACLISRWRLWKRSKNRAPANSSLRLSVSDVCCPCDIQKSIENRYSSTTGCRVKYTLKSSVVLALIRLRSACFQVWGNLLPSSWHNCLPRLRQMRRDFLPLTPTKRTQITRSGNYFWQNLMVKLVTKLNRNCANVVQWQRVIVPTHVAQLEMKPK